MDSSTLKAPTTQPADSLAYILKHIYPVECPQSEQSTLKKMRTVVARWQEIMGDVPVGKIDRQKMIEFRNRCLKLDLAAPTINSHVRVVLALARITGHKVDGERLKLQEHMQPKPTPSLEDLNRIWRFADAAQWPLSRTSDGRAVWCGVSPSMWWRGVLMLAFSTGLRRSDLFGLKWSEVQSDRIPTINRKTKKPQYLPIPEPLQPWLALLRKQGTITVLGHSGQQSQIWREMKQLGCLAKVHGFDLQSIRRASARAYERAHEGCGRLILNHFKTVTERSYLDVFETLKDATKDLVYPTEFLRPIDELQKGMQSAAAPFWPNTNRPAIVTSAPTQLDRPLTDVNAWDFL